MSISVAEEPDLSLTDYESVPISFRVESVLEVGRTAAGLAGLTLTERRCPAPYTKEYDQPGNRPSDWRESWDISRWGIFTARDAGNLVGGAAVAWGTPQLSLLEGCEDVSALWDIRVSPSRRGNGIGAALFDAAVDWSRARRAVGMKIETQSTNVPACRFYASRGCVLATIDTRAYPSIPHEAQLIWYLAL